MSVYKFKGGIIKAVLIAIVFLILAGIMFWRIGSYNEFFDPYVPPMIAPAVHKVLLGDSDDASAWGGPEFVTWQWTDMYQSGAGRSPLHFGIVSVGLSLFGFTLFGVRIVNAVLAFLVLILVYFCMKKFYSKAFSLIFVVLLGTAPLYLLFSRGGGILATTFPLILAAFCFVSLMFSEKDKINSKWYYLLLPIVAGVLTGLLPYGYIVTRPIMLFLIIWVLLNFKKLGIRNVVMFLVPIIGFLLIQFVKFDSWNDVLKAFFGAGGEAIRPEDIGDRFEKISGNIVLVVKTILGVNGENGFQPFGNINVASTTVFGTTVIYPPFMVLFFVTGFIWNICDWIRQRASKYFIPIVLLLIGVIPAIMAGVGSSDPARISMVIFPIYYFIVYAFYKLFVLFGSWRKKIGVYILSIVFMATMVYQVHNFYSHPKGRDDGELYSRLITEVIDEYFAENPEAKIIVRGRTDAPIDFCYVREIWWGGEKFEERVKAGQIIFSYHSNIGEIKDIMVRRQADAIIALERPELMSEIPELRRLPFRKLHDAIGIYTLK